MPSLVFRPGRASGLRRAHKGKAAREDNTQAPCNLLCISAWSMGISGREDPLDRGPDMNESALLPSSVRPKPDPPSQRTGTNSIAIGLPIGPRHTLLSGNDD